MTHKEFTQSIQHSDSTEKHQARYRHINHLIEQNHNELKALFKKLQEIDGRIGVNFKVKYLKRDIMYMTSRNVGARFIQTALDLFMISDDEVAKCDMVSILVCFQNQDQLIEIAIKRKCKEAVCMIMHEMIAQGSDMNKNKWYKKLKKINHDSDYRMLSLFPLEPEKELTFKY